MTGSDLKLPSRGSSSTDSAAAAAIRLQHLIQSAQPQIHGQNHPQLGHQNQNNLPDHVNNPEAAFDGMVNGQFHFQPHQQEQEQVDFYQPQQLQQSFQEQPVMNPTATPPNDSECETDPPNHIALNPSYKPPPTTNRYPMEERSEPENDGKANKIMGLSSFHAARSFHSNYDSNNITSNMTKVSGQSRSSSETPVDLLNPPSSQKEFVQTHEGMMMDGNWDDSSSEAIVIEETDADDDEMMINNREDFIDCDEFYDYLNELSDEINDDEMMSSEENA